MCSSWSPLLGLSGAQGLDASELARRTMELRLVLGECAQIIRFSPYDMLDMGRYFYWHPEYVSFEGLELKI